MTSLGTNCCWEKGTHVEVDDNRWRKPKTHHTPCRHTFRVQRVPLLSVPAVSVMNCKGITLEQTHHIMAQHADPFLLIFSFTSSEAFAVNFTAICTAVGSSSVANLYSVNAVASTNDQPRGYRGSCSDVSKLRPNESRTLTQNAQTTYLEVSYYHPETFPDARFVFPPPLKAPTQHSMLSPLKIRSILHRE